jgi:transcriptional regulator with XRE-family HTH domain
VPENTERDTSADFNQMMAGGSIIFCHMLWFCGRCQSEFVRLRSLLQIELAHLVNILTRSPRFRTAEISSVLDRQLLLQLGDQLKRLRKSKGLGTVEMAARAGITRNTLRAIESGDLTTAIGTYLRIISILGISGELAMLAGDMLLPSPAGSAAARSRRADCRTNDRVGYCGVDLFLSKAVVGREKPN